MGLGSEVDVPTSHVFISQAVLYSFHSLFKKTMLDVLKATTD